MLGVCIDASWKWEGDRCGRNGSGGSDCRGSKTPELEVEDEREVELKGTMASREVAVVDFEVCGVVEEKDRKWVSSRSEVSKGRLRKVKLLERSSSIARHHHHPEQPDLLCLTHKRDQIR